MRQTVVNGSFLINLFIAGLQQLFFGFVDAVADAYSENRTVGGVERRR